MAQLTTAQSHHYAFFPLIAPIFAQDLHLGAYACTVLTTRLRLHSMAFAQTLHAYDANVRQAQSVLRNNVISLPLRRLVLQVTLPR
ncbi:MAG: hypothetical protein QOI13_2694, partial [Paraburkholderia sp.]|nr:hypothetical protein [Paraburkholderia sp.]